ncbi:16S rRNA (adenine(1518)-N(6)/adenine(1519)-N(6))-dimethyltransferase RsmA [Agrococcus sp. SL85]|uniref:16S rRNA (adenine(1518)-N(6)/adenine(1519)-N(6))- dimethyltransferase RsmA n=1 Tax=Agrococcus sp. SL85 TaxID=2995141 RepID=UPI00226CAB8C|nr:16S rRNA (adenine(1518)-N(6)/adenine(1519)-N(6))-dimethyltransferase RsmA [Agrococcus sp. SL85]WAC66467.1 16S rRNA (adenine(1518)-N(6)/adenine(1519)-N(6))-dimethyltransferase RsmA [Agrococcus sp. SL85]
MSDETIPARDARAADALLGAAEIRRLAASLDLTPTKRWGQNFVHDANTVRRIVRTADVAGLDVVEVGPGLGSLTLGLTEAGCRVTAVEIDERLATLLPETVGAKQPEARLEVVHHDALTIEALPHEPRAIVANLPYNVSVPVLIHLLERFPSVERALVMVQAEVGHRLAAQPGSKVYGSPSAKVAWWGPWALEGDVSRQIFWPVPNVDSVLVGFRRGPSMGDEALRRRAFRVIDAAFGQRRKMLRQALSGLFGSSAEASAALEAADVAPTDRGEALALPDFIRIAQQLRD